MGSQASRLRSRGDTARADAAAAMDAIRRLVRFLRLADRRAEVAAGISAAQLYVLRTLAEAPTASMAELAERTLTDQSSVSTVVARLVERGLVRRGRAAGDARKIELALTERGRAAAEASPELAQVAIVEAIVRMPATRRRALVASLDGFVRDIGAGPLPARMLFEDEPAPAKRRRS